MKTPFDTNEILMGLLMGNTSIKGGYYHEGDRPDNSTDEDIVVNTIDLTQVILVKLHQQSLLSSTRTEKRK